jgi:hypothetical protein
LLKNLKSLNTKLLMVGEIGGKSAVLLNDLKFQKKVLVWMLML